VLAILALEMLVAWRWGPSRAAGIGVGSGSVRPAERKFYLRVLSTAVALVPLALAVGILATLAHYERTGNLLGFLPESYRQSVEQAVGVPAAQPGEGTKWRLEGFTAFVRNSVTDRRIVLTLTVAAVLLTLAIYRLERRAGSGIKRLIVPGALRTLTFLLALLFLLPQMRIAFDREGWPEVVILLDTSASMATDDDFKDPAVRAKAEELRRAAGLSEAHRLKLAQLLLTRKDADWLDILLREKQVKLYVFAVDSQTRPVVEIDDVKDLDKAREALTKLTPVGESSHLGDGVQHVLKSFRGSSLAALIMFTDGVTTNGDDLPKAAREASRAGVPLFLVGVGDTREVPDLGLTALQVEDVVTRGDRLLFAGRLTARGALPNTPVPVILYERQGEKLVERGRTSVLPNPTAGFTEFKITHTPMEAGEKQFVIEVAPAPGEVEFGNNKIERTVVVTETKRVRVLYVEGETRYDFRYVKVLLERESDRIAGNKSIELKTVLLSAAKGWSETDRSALSDFPTRHPRGLRPEAAAAGVADAARPRRLRAGEGRRASGAGGRDGGAGGLRRYPVSRRAADRPHGGRATGADPREPTRDRRISPQAHARGATAPAVPVLHGRSRVDADLEPPPTAVLVRPRVPPQADRGSAGGPPRPRGGGRRGRREPPACVAAVQRLRAGAVHGVRRDVAVAVAERRGDVQQVLGAGRAATVAVAARARRTEARQADVVPPRRADRLHRAVPGRRAGPAAGSIPRAVEGEYKFLMSEPDTPGSRPRAEARVLPPPTERDRLEMNRADLVAAASLSNGGFYTLADADDVLKDMKNLQRVPLNQPCPPLSLWNQPAVYLLVMLLLVAEWLLRKRERLL
jgi:hypothetical protein